MAGSQLLPAILHQKHPTFKTPVYTIVGGSIISFGLCFLDYYKSLDAILFNSCILLGTVSYLSQCVGYIYLKKNFRTMERKFHSPLGNAGAIYSILIWLVTVVAIVCFQQDNQLSVLVTLSILAVCSVYYHVHAKHVQKFSEEERKSLFFAHVGALSRWDVYIQVHSALMCVANHNNSKRHSKRSSGRWASPLKKVFNVVSSLKPSNSIMTSTTNHQVDAPRVRDTQSGRWDKAKVGSSKKSESRPT
ncbi:Aste57867_5280 [Aphanomyces stellatus]|uniref:Aste57867_5280 protein n=1 Tax=Aphanomyces stellatus TaxID=120398 RepID=A0A485KGX0_9STRA|nr:hypothetical protein As57867_005267 [Aphanomyces stellatus]VFT82349.1 Aste57867_5280 [Aphanomyces stellatus]